MEKSEFKDVIGTVFELMSTDPVMGPKLYKVRLPQRFIFPDQKLILNVTFSEPEDAAEGRYLKWVWGDKSCDWKPEVEMMMDSHIALRFFQGKINVPIAMAKGEIKSKGSIAKSLKLIPAIKPVYKQFRAWLEDNGYEHLVA